MNLTSGECAVSDEVDMLTLSLTAAFANRQVCSDGCEGRRSKECPANPMCFSGVQTSKPDVNAARPQVTLDAREDLDASEDESEKSSSEDDDMEEEQYFAVKAKDRQASYMQSEMDIIRIAASSCDGF